MGRAGARASILAGALTPALSRGERGLVCLANGVWVREGATASGFGRGPHPSPLPGGEGACLSGERRVGTGRGDGVRFWPGPSPQPSPGGRGGFFVWRTACGYGKGRWRPVLAGALTPALSRGERGLVCLANGVWVREGATASGFGRDPHPSPLPGGEGACLSSKQNRVSSLQRETMTTIHGRSRGNV